MNLLQKTKRNLNRRWAGEQYLSFLVFLLFRWVDENKILDKFLIKWKDTQTIALVFLFENVIPIENVETEVSLPLLLNVIHTASETGGNRFVFSFFCTIHMIIIKCCSWYFYWGKIFERALELVSNEKRKTRRCVKGHVAIGGTLVFISSFFF